MKKLLALFLCALFALGLTGCKSREKYTYTAWDSFDTVTTVVGYADSKAVWDSQMAALHEDLLYYHRQYDIYNAYPDIHNLYTVNQNAGVAPVAVDDAILDLLDLAREMTALTGGKMDVTQGAVLALWHDARTAGLDDPAHAALPDTDALEQAAQHSGWDNVVVDRAAKTVFITDPDLQLDVGSIGKGFAVEQAAQQAEARGLDCARLGVGGNMRAIGQKPDGSAWVAGLQSPEDPEGGPYVARVGLLDGFSLVTSGDYQRYYTVDGVRYAHLIDFDTLYPARQCTSVSVVCADSGRADALSTGLFCLSEEDGVALANSLPGVEALWTFSDGSCTTTPGFDAYVQ